MSLNIDIAPSANLAEPLTLPPTIAPIVAEVAMEEAGEDVYNEHSRPIARFVLQSMHSEVVRRTNPVAATQLSNQASDALRESYLKLFSEQLTKPEDERFWWKQQFVEAGNLLMEHIRDMAISQPAVPAASSSEVEQEEETFCIQYNNTVFKFTAEQNVILIGAFPGCDVLLRQFGGSRLAMILFRLPGGNVLVDVGGLFGFSITSRSVSGKPLDQSKMNDRRCIFLDRGETAVVAAGDRGYQKITIHPKVCIVCFEKPRNIELPCKHFILCSTCVFRVHPSICPTCKAEFTHNQVHAAQNANSFVP
jgi:hypothetical protein